MRHYLHNSLRALLLSLAVLLSLPMLAVEIEIDGIRYDLNADAKQATVVSKSDKYYGSIVIPESVEHEGVTHSVTSIGSSAFYGCSGLTAVNIRNGVTSIGSWAFAGCSGLTSVTIPNSVTSIGSCAFSGCYGLTSVTIPNSVTSIEYSAFDSCSGLTSIFVEDGNPVYDSRNNCNAIIKTATNTLLCGCKTTIIPNSVTRIEAAAFLGCSGLTSVTIPNSVTSICGKAFEGCSGLTSVTIPNSVTSIEDYTFAVCSGLTSVTIPNSVTSIGNGAFESCSGLTSVIIPNSVRSIGWSTFMYCRGLTSVTIPNNVESIGGYAFYACSGLTSVTIGRSVRSIGEVSFSFCYNLLDVYCYAEKVHSTDSYVFYSSPIADATLHVPAASVENYKASGPWSGFGKIVALTDEEHIVDGTLEEYVNESERSPIDIHYTRTLPNMLWNPLYVPFKIPYEDLQENYEVAYINTMHSYDNDDNGEIDDMVMEIVKIKAGTLKPNHPYLIKARNAEAMEMSIVQENTTLYPAEITTLDCSSVYTKFEITGTYQEMNSGDLNGSLVISTDGAWKKLSSTSILKPFRFYLTISSREGSPVEIAEEAMSRVRIRVMGEDDNATGIDEVKTANDELKSEIYDLSGRRVSAPAKGGVYIVNGKKVIY